MACAEQHSCFESGPPIEIVLYAIYLYLSGLSLRQTARTLASIGVKRSREAVRK